MQLFVRGRCELHTIDVVSSEKQTIGDVKIVLAELEDLPLDEMVLYCAGKPLEDDVIVSSCVSDMATLDLDIRMIGGKVHGSLARAGKVKGQTPKVEKKEKRKKKTGRAKRRLQYNRRFVNVVATFGKKKGPNSNSQ